MTKKKAPLREGRRNLKRGIFMDEKTFNISVSPNELKAVAADLINMEFNNGYVVLSFIQTYASMPEDESKPLIRNGVVMSRVMLSWEHLARFSADLNNFVKSTKENAEKNTQKAFELVENMKLFEAKNEQD